jgi:hypothetical protein
MWPFSKYCGLPSSSSNLAEELSVLSVASASCYSYPSVLPEMSELAPQALANIRAQFCNGQCEAQASAYGLLKRWPRHADGIVRQS